MKTSVTGNTSNCRTLILAFLFSFLLTLSSRQAWSKGYDYGYDARASAQAKIDAFNKAIAPNSGATYIDKMKALNAVKGDPIATTMINNTGRYGSNPRKTAKQLWDGFTEKMENNIKENCVKKWGGKKSDYSVAKPTNQRPQAQPGQPQIRISNDLDVTVMKNNKPISAKHSQAIVEKAAYDAGGGKKVFGNKSPAQATKNLRIEVTDPMSAESYGGSPTEGKKALGTDKSKPLADKQQLPEAMKYKSNEPSAEAAKAKAAADKIKAEQLAKGKSHSQANKAAKHKHIDAEKLKYDQAYQAVKQYDRQVKGQVKAGKGKIPKQVSDGMEILRDVKDLKITPDEARAKLAKMGETPESIINKSASLVESAQKTTHAGKPVANPAVENAMNKWNHKVKTKTTGEIYTVDKGSKAVQKTIANRQKFDQKIAAGKSGGIPGANPIGGGPFGNGSFTMTSTKGMQTGMKGLTAGGYILGGLAVYDIGKDYWESGDEWKATKSTAWVAGTTYGGIKVMGGVAKVSPTLAIVLGTYMVTKGLTEEALNRTETGQAINKAVTEYCSDTAEVYDEWYHLLNPANLLPGKKTGDPVDTHDMNAYGEKIENLIAMVKSGEYETKMGMTMADAITFSEYVPLSQILKKKKPEKPEGPSQAELDEKARQDHDQKQDAYETAYLDAVKNNLIKPEEKEKFQHGYDPEKGAYDPGKGNQWAKSQDNGADDGTEDGDQQPGGEYADSGGKKTGDDTPGDQPGDADDKGQTPNYPQIATIPSTPTYPSTPSAGSQSSSFPSGPSGTGQGGGSILDGLGSQIGSSIGGAAADAATGGKKGNVPPPPSGYKSYDGPLGKGWTKTTDGGGEITITAGKPSGGAGGGATGTWGGKGTGGGTPAQQTQPATPAGGMPPQTTGTPPPAGGGQPAVPPAGTPPGGQPQDQQGEGQWVRVVPDGFKGDVNSIKPTYVKQGTMSDLLGGVTVSDSGKDGTTGGTQTKDVQHDPKDKYIGSGGGTTKPGEKPKGTSEIYEKKDGTVYEVITKDNGTKSVDVISGPKTYVDKTGSGGGGYIVSDSGKTSIDLKTGKVTHEGDTGTGDQPPQTADSAPSTSTPQPPQHGGGDKPKPPHTAMDSIAGFDPSQAVSDGIVHVRDYRGGRILHDTKRGAYIYEREIDGALVRDVLGPASKSWTPESMVDAVTTSREVATDQTQTQVPTEKIDLASVPGGDAAADPGAADIPPIKKPELHIAPEWPGGGTKKKDLKPDAGTSSVDPAQDSGKDDTVAVISDQSPGGDQLADAGTGKDTTTTPSVGQIPLQESTVPGTDLQKGITAPGDGLMKGVSTTLPADAQKGIAASSGDLTVGQGTTLATDVQKGVSAAGTSLDGSGTVLGTTVQGVNNIGTEVAKATGTELSAAGKSLGDGVAGGMVRTGDSSDQPIGGKDIRTYTTPGPGPRSDLPAVAGAAHGGKSLGDGVAGGMVKAGDSSKQPIQIASIPKDVAAIASAGHLLPPRQPLKAKPATGDAVRPDTTAESPPIPDEWVTGDRGTPGSVRTEPHVAGTPSIRWPRNCPWERAVTRDAQLLPDGITHTKEWGETFVVKSGRWVPQDMADDNLLRAMNRKLKDGELVATGKGASWVARHNELVPAGNAPEGTIRTSSRGKWWKMQNGEWVPGENERNGTIRISSNGKAWIRQNEKWVPANRCEPFTVAQTINGEQMEFINGRWKLIKRSIQPPREELPRWLRDIIEAKKSKAERSAPGYTGTALKGAEADNGAKGSARDAIDEILKEGGQTDGYITRSDTERSIAVKDGYQGIARQKDITASTTLAETKIKEAQILVDGAGQEAQDLASQKASEIATKDQGTGWGSVIGDGLIKGVAQGIEQAGKTLGSELGNAAAGALFDDGKKAEVTPVPATEKESQVATSKPSYPRSSKPKPSCSDTKTVTKPSGGSQPCPAEPSQKKTTRHISHKPTKPQKPQPKKQTHGWDPEWGGAGLTDDKGNWTGPGPDVR